MKDLFDFDALFEEKMAQFMQENAGKYTEKQWESIIAKMYKSYGDTLIKKIGNTPKGYFAEMSNEELVKTLKRHIVEGVSVSDFLCSELEGRDCPDELIDLLSENDEELLILTVNLAGSAPKAFGAYFRLLKECANQDVKDAVIDALKVNADEAKEYALQCYEQGVERESMLEILSRCQTRDDRIFEILVKEFRLSPEEIPMYASYLAAYGDERALPVLLEYIDNDDINYLEYQELKYAIEALGGEYTKVRDFSEDKYFQEILEQSQITPDFSESDGKTDA